VQHAKRDATSFDLAVLQERDPIRIGAASNRLSGQRSNRWTISPGLSHIDYVDVNILNMAR
jgi:hypothetical protein